MKAWLLLAGAILTEVTASLSLKAAAEQPLWYVLVAVGFTSAFVFLTAVLKEGMNLGVAYGVWGALGVALTAIMGAVLYGEPLTGLMLVGIALVIGGVLTVELGSQHAAGAKPDTASRPLETEGAR
ncbi:multidrug efflux SMR transporter [Glycomyces luteolus]|uniref:Multidrug efflux SMR transporter n=1 Tax=Glycomyces luteolus TaxID=2670330 RepID=A0A9X3SRX6_9ACTN|nr:multidrug efflux SMR transporter [Glycomyces luteolus]MDA1360494.1 multidrug efflux SMR transporter [Glycomyces luteolus]